MQNKPYFFFWKQGFPKGGEGVRHLGNIPKKSRFFLGVASLNQFASISEIKLEFARFQTVFHLLPFTSQVQKSLITDSKRLRISLN